MGTIKISVLAQSLSNFTCKLLMIRGRTLLILGHEVKGQGQLLPHTMGIPCFALSFLAMTLKNCGIKIMAFVL